MGLFGLFYPTFVLGCKGAMGIKNSLKDSENKTKHRDDETNTYFDHSMLRRDLVTNHLMSIETKWNGEIWLKDCDTGHYVRNLTVERAEKKYQEEKAKAARGESDRTHIRYGNIDYHQEKIPGYRYKDFKTGMIYVVREMALTPKEYTMIGEEYSRNHYIVNMYALIDPHKLKAVRLTDRSIEFLLYRRLSDEEIKAFSDEFLERFNKYIHEPYTYFDITDPIQRGGSDASFQDSGHEGKFVSYTRKEMEYKYGSAIKNIPIKPNVYPDPEPIDGRYICVIQYTTPQGLTCYKGDIVDCDKKGFIKNVDNKYVGNINTFLRDYFKKVGD